MTPDGYSEIGDSSNNAVFRWVTNAGQFVDNFSIVRGARPWCAKTRRRLAKGKNRRCVRRAGPVNFGSGRGFTAFSQSAYTRPRLLSCAISAA